MPERLNGFGVASATKDIRQKMTVQAPNGILPEISTEDARITVRNMSFFITESSTHSKTSI